MLRCNFGVFVIRRNSYDRAGNVTRVTNGFFFASLLARGFLVCFDGYESNDSFRFLRFLLFTILFHDENGYGNWFYEFKEELFSND